MNVGYRFCFNGRTLGALMHIGSTYKLRKTSVSPTSLSRSPRGTGGRGPLARNNTLLIRTLYLGCIALFILHLALGSNIYMLAVMLFISVVGFLSISGRRIFVSDALVFGTAMYSGFLTLVVKGGLGQPLQSNLQHPIYSTTLLLCGFCALVCSAHLARRFVQNYRPNRIAQVFNDLSVQRRIFWPLLIAGISFFVLHITFRPTHVNGVLLESGGFGGFGSLYFLLIFGLCVGMSLYGRTGNRRVLLTLLVVGAIMLLLAIAANTKKEFAEFLLVVLVGLFAYGLKISVRHIVAGVALIIVMLFYLSPTIHIMRTHFRDLTIFERVTKSYEVLEEHNFSAFKLRESEGRFMAGFTHSYRASGSYVYPSTLSVDRFMLILPIDQVVRGQESRDEMGIGIFLPEILDGILPSFLITKNTYVGADLVAWEYGIRQFGNSARPVIGMTASSLAAAGLLGVILFPFLIILPILLLGNLLFFDLRSGPLGYFIIVFSWYLAEKEFDSLIVFSLRSVVIAYIFFVALAFVMYRRASSGNRSAKPLKKLGS